MAGGMKYYEFWKKHHREKAFPFRQINIQIIPKGCMRPQYAESWGDYWVDERGILQVRVVEFEDLDRSLRVAIHEVLEAWRCYRDGITLESIEQWDADHADHDDPGSLPDAPYHEHHMASIAVEMVMCAQDGDTWKDYDNATPKEG